MVYGIAVTAVRGGEIGTFVVVVIILHTVSPRMLRFPRGPYRNIYKLVSSLNIKMSISSSDQERYTVFNTNNTVLYKICRLT